MILIGLGSNISGPWGSPRQALERALVELDQFPLRLVRHSTVIDTDPFGRKNQPRFVNAVAVVETHLAPEALIQKLQAIERSGGRKRTIRWGPRTIDLDILDYHGRVLNQRKSFTRLLKLPHPGIAQRSFVLEPIAEIAPRWIH
ncbi:MAG: 2-amino-4-hydroxy-6-hydroxymethyldihydropteridine diphosphokinase, partial [Pseudomonadota bacterium]